MNSLFQKNLKVISFVIEDNISKNELDDLEIFYIQYFKFIGCNLTNQSPGGKTRGGFKHTEEHKLKMSLKLKGKKPWNAGKKLTEEQKINHFVPENFIKLSKESLERRTKQQIKTKALKSKISNDTIKFIRANYPKYNQRQLAEMFNVRCDYISDVVNFKIRKYV